jgi:LPPG:FO 2-phospho-L-lactate transferase
MSDQPVRTRVHARGRWWPLQEFMIKGRGDGPVEDIELRGAAAAAATPEVVKAVTDARAIVIGPSNPSISIGPILATPGVSEALKATSAPVVAVSPLVGGQVLKGPTAAFMEHTGQPLSSDGIAATYAGLIDGLVADEPTDRVATLEIDVLLGTPEQRRSVAAQTLEFALTLSRGTASE